MKPSSVLKMNMDVLALIFSRYPMFSNFRVTGSVGQYEDTDASDIDFYFDADSSATLFDIGRLKEELENIFLLDVDLISSNRESSLLYEKNYKQFPRKDAFNE